MNKTINQYNPFDTIVLPLPSMAACPLVSVLMANYNYSRYIGEAIESVQKQDYKNYEIIVCDDGSTDNSCEVIERYIESDLNIALIRKENGGHASGINRAFTESRGDIICILDADDTFEINKLTKVVSAFTKNSDSGIVIHHLRIIDGEGRKKRIIRYKRDGYLGSDIPTLRMGLPMPQASGLCFRRKVLEQILPLPQELFRSAADWAIAYTAAYLTKTTLVPEVLANYRIHSTNLSGTTSTALHLHENMVEKTLGGMNRVIGFVDKFMQTHFGVAVSASQTRNILEHRLILGFLTRDKDLITASTKDLRVAYRVVRRDYPAHRYYFWQLLSFLPLSLSRSLLILAFHCFRLQSSLRSVYLN